MIKKPIVKPAFKNEDEEATWWASRQGRAFLKQHSASSSGKSLAAQALEQTLAKHGQRVKAKFPLIRGNGPVIDPTDEQIENAMSG